MLLIAITNHPTCLVDLYRMLSKGLNEHILNKKVIERLLNRILGSEKDSLNPDPWV